MIHPYLDRKVSYINNNMGFDNKLCLGSDGDSLQKCRFPTKNYYIRKLVIFSLEFMGDIFHSQNNSSCVKFSCRKALFISEKETLNICMVLWSLRLNNKIFFLSKCNSFFNRLFRSVDFPIRLLSHELKSTFFNVKSYLEIIYEYKYSLNEDQLLHFLESTNTEIYRASLLMNNLLDNSKINIQNCIFSVENLSFVLFFMDFYRLNSLQKKILLYSDNLYFFCRVKCNPLLIQQVLSNLLSNSLRFTVSGGKLLLRVNRGFIWSLVELEIQTFLRFSLIDNGIGASNDIFSLCENKIGYKILMGFLRVHRSESHYYRLLFRGNLGFFNLIS